MIDVGLREPRATPHADDVTLDDVVAIEQFRKVDRLGQPVAEPPAHEGIEGQLRLLTNHRRPVVEPWSGEERDIATRLQHPEEAFPERRHEADVAIPVIAVQRERIGRVGDDRVVDVLFGFNEIKTVADPDLDLWRPVWLDQCGFARRLLGAKPATQAAQPSGFGFRFLRLQFRRFFPGLVQFDGQQGGFLALQAVLRPSI